MAAGLPPKRLFQISEDENVTGSSLGSELPASSTSSTPSKKKRNLPRSTNSDVEVIALSPRTLMATNRFICEVCNKGFPRVQNLQLHRRSHNLPWKLKQKSTKEVKKKVYLCPEPTCVHHDPSRALGDLTGIKKHFSRKHGEKKWKCEKCSKKYAVQSDWKAHSKTCGTREYRCDCGTLFSRRDSFITHRAFCDALAQESATLPTGLNAMGGQLYASNNMGLGLSQYQMGSLADQNQPAANILSLGAVGTSQIFDPDASSSNPSFRQQNRPLTASTGNQDFQEDSRPEFLQSKRPTHYHGLLQLPDISVNNNNNNNNNMSAMKASSNAFDLGFLSSNINNKEIGRGNNLMIQDQFDVNIMSDPNITMAVPSLYNSQLRSDCVLPQMSATALLQKAAQMGATTSVNHEILFRSIDSSTTKSTSPDASSIGRGLPWQDQRRSSSSSPSSSSWHKATQDLSNSTEQHFPSTFPVRNLQTLDHQLGGSAFHSGQDPHFQQIMNSLVNDSHEPMFGDGGRGMTSLGGCSGDNRIDPEMRRSNISNMFRSMEGKLCHSVGVSPSSNIGATDELTRDFLGVGGMLNGGLNVKGSGYSHGDHHHDQTGQQNQFNTNSGPMDSEVMFLPRSCRERMHR